MHNRAYYVTRAAVRCLVGFSVISAAVIGPHMLAAFIVPTMT